MTPPEIRELLAVLRQGGVRTATLSPDGALLAVELYPTPPAELPAQAPQDTREDAALAVLVELSRSQELG